MADMSVENLAAMMVAQTVAKMFAMSVELQVDVSAVMSETCAAFQMADKWDRDVAASLDVVKAGSMEPCTAVGTG